MKGSVFSLWVLAMLKQLHGVDLSGHQCQLILWAERELEMYEMSFLVFNKVMLAAMWGRTAALFILLSILIQNCKHLLISTHLREPPSQSRPVNLKMSLIYLLCSLRLQCCSASDFCLLYILRSAILSFLWLSYSDGTAAIQTHWISW